jgi:pyruvate dehydrogenase E1 component alpha subunit
MGALLAKGVPPGILLAQLYGKETGFSRGKDSFLHGGSLEYGVFGSTSMLGASLPVACGVALRFKLKRERHVAVAFFGEGTSSRGDVHEALNFAGIHKLPVIFVCENNRYAYSTPLSLQMAIDNVAERAAGYGFKGVICSGNDLLEVLEVAGKAVDRARQGEGPTLIECKTYRVLGHSAHDRAAYRGVEEVLHWESRDPIRQWEIYLELKGVDVNEARTEVEARITAELDEAVRFAEESADPRPEEALTDLYASPASGVPEIHAEPSGPEMRTAHLEGAGAAAEQAAPTSGEQGKNRPLLH